LAERSQVLLDFVSTARQLVVRDRPAYRTVLVVIRIAVVRLALANPIIEGVDNASLLSGFP
jgi:hypothetical protein